MATAEPVGQFLFVILNLWGLIASSPDEVESVVD